MSGQFALLLPLAAAWALAVMLPGPNFMAIAWTASVHGRRAALHCVAGVLTGAAFWIAAGLFGLSTLMAALPLAGSVIKLAGAAYLVWFGLQMVFTAEAGAAAPRAGRGLSAYRVGLGTTLANPKSAAVAASLLAVALPEGSPGWFAAEVFAVLLAISATWYLAVGLVASLPPVVRGFASVRLYLTRAAGAVFVVFGLKLGLER